MGYFFYSKCSAQSGQYNATPTWYTTGTTDPVCNPPKLSYYSWYSDYSRLKPHVSTSSYFGPAALRRTRRWVPWRHTSYPWVLRPHVVIPGIIYVCIPLFCENIFLPYDMHYRPSGSTTAVNCMQEAVWGWYRKYLTKYYCRNMYWSICKSKATNYWSGRSLLQPRFCE